MESSLTQLDRSFLLSSSLVNNDRQLALQNVPQQHFIPQHHVTKAPVSLMHLRPAPNKSNWSKKAMLGV